MAASLISPNRTKGKMKGESDLLAMIEIGGLIGLVILVTAFLLQSAGFLRGKEQYFYFFNAVGAALLTWYAISLPNIYFAVLEGIWSIGAFASLSTIFYRQGTITHAIIRHSKSTVTQAVVEQSDND